MVKVKSLSRVRLFVTPWTVARQAPQSMGFSRQEYWSGLPFPSPGDLPNSGIEPRSSALQADALLSEMVAITKKNNWYCLVIRRRQWHPTPALLARKSHGRRSLVGCSPWVARVGHDWATSLSLFTFMHWRRKWQPTPVFLPGESQGRGSLVGCHLWGHTESDTTEVT